MPHRRHQPIRVRARLAAAGIALALVASACDTGTEPASDASPNQSAGSEATPGTDSSGIDNSAALEAVYAALDGLTGEARTAKLVELAEAEEGLDLYGATNLEDAQVLFEAFEDLYGIEPNYYRSSSTGVLRRVTEEAKASFAGNDAVMMNGPDLALLDVEGLLSPLRTPATEDIIEVGVFDNWASVYMNTYIATWNTDRVTTPPTTWEELLTDFDGQLALELGDWIWFATITKHYFMAEQGMTEAEVVEMMKGAAREARIMDGHTPMVELVIAGEYDAAASAYHHRVSSFIAEGAPLAWEPPIKPVIMRPSGAAIMKHAKNPASALLWIEFLLTDGQQIMADDFRGPASTKVEGGIPPEYDPIIVDIDAVTGEREKWEGLWAEIVAESGQPVD